MSTRSKVGFLVVAIVIVGLIGSLGAYQVFWKEQLRPATGEEVAAHLQGDWTGISVNNVYESREGTVRIGRLDGNRFEGEEDWRGQTLCPEKVFSGIFEENKVSWEFTYVNVSAGSPAYCRMKGETHLEMRMGEDGTPYLIGSWKVEGWSGSLELEKVR